MEMVGMCSWMDNHTQGYISTDTCAVTPKTGHSSQPLWWTAQPLLAKVGISFKYALKGPLSSSLLLSSVADTTTANGMQCRECGSRDVADQTTASQKAGQTHRQEPLPAPSEQQPWVWGCLDHNTTSTHQGTLQSPHHSWRAREGGVANRACRGWPGRSAGPSCYFHFHILLVPCERLHVNPDWLIHGRKPYVGRKQLGLMTFSMFEAAKVCFNSQPLLWLTAFLQLHVI